LCIAKYNEALKNEGIVHEKHEKHETFKGQSQFKKVRQKKGVRDEPLLF